MKKRYLQQSIQEDALESRKIAFISGPRQIGKTTLALELLKHFNCQENYFNWDDLEFKKIWAQSPKTLLQNQDRNYLVFDEIHKDRLWKNKLKGLYDLFQKKSHFIVTGSARIDFFRKSGDSLQGRYIPYRLHPFSIGETAHFKPPPVKDWQEHINEKPSFKLEDLLSLSGFPEPLLGSSLNKAKRWQRLYRERMVREDVRDLQNLKEISVIDNLSLLLTERASHQLSYSSLKEDLSCSFESVLRWIDLLEAVYYCYRIRPYSNKIKNSLKKEPKLFFYDWTFAQDNGPRWENFIAGHLLKNVQAWTDCAFGEFELFYVRDKQKREVDFLVTKNKKPYLLLEVKSNQSRPTSSLIHFQAILKPQFCIQLVKHQSRELATSLSHPQIEVMNATRFLSCLN